LSEFPLSTIFWFRTGYTDPRGSDCMPWLGYTTAQGYGQLVHGGEKLYAHRVSYSLAYLNGDPIPENLVVRHRCPGGPRVDCVRPSHLELGTYAENSADIIEDGRTQVIEPPCPNIVAAIRHLYASGRFSQGDISKMIWGGGHAQPTIQRLVSGKTYTKCEGPITKRGRGRQPKERQR